MCTVRYGERPATIAPLGFYLTQPVRFNNKNRVVGSAHWLAVHLHYDYNGKWARGRKPCLTWDDRLSIEEKSEGPFVELRTFGVRKSEGLDSLNRLRSYASEKCYVAEMIQV